MEMPTQTQILNEVICISHSADIFRKGIWRSIQPLTGMSCSFWWFSPKSNCTAPFVKLKEPPPFTTLGIFDLNSGVAVSSDRFKRRSRFNFGWNLHRKKNHCSWKKQFLSQQQEHKKRFSYNKTFSRLLSLSHHKRNYTNA